MAAYLTAMTCAIWGSPASVFTIPSSAGIPRRGPDLSRSQAIFARSGADSAMDARAAGAYRFVLRPGVTTALDVDARLFLRKAVRSSG